MTGNRLPPPVLSRLADVRSCGVITGLGMSRESGFDPGTAAVEIPDSSPDALSAGMLAHDPERTWAAIGHLLRQAASVAPNAGHHALARIERSVDRFVLLTGNIDGLHHRAGSRKVIELSGNLFETRCPGCATTGHIEAATLDAGRPAPICAVCDRALHPGIVLAGELPPMGAVEPLLEEFYLRPPDLVLVAGVGSDVGSLHGYIAEPVLLARQAGCLTLEIGAEPPLLEEHVEYSFEGNIGELLTELAREIGVGRPAAANDERGRGKDGRLNPPSRRSR